MIGKVLDNRYELVEFIGKGGMALVYRAIDKRTGHNVAVKILRPEYNQDAEFCTRFEREAVAASKMSHHNIVNLLDVGQDDNMRYLVMEYVRGRTLKEVIKQNGPLNPNVAAQVAIRILSALQHAHKNGIIHRDIKPQNILVHSDGLIKVGDFGIARVAGSNTISTDDIVMGSVHYFSPEQAKGEPVTAASDLYSVGVVLYEMLTGKPPFDGETPVAIAMQHIGGKAQPIREIDPTIPPALERVVDKAMEKRPERRYQSALEMAQDILRAIQEPDGVWMGPSSQAASAPVEQPAGNAEWGKTGHTKSWLWARFGVIAMMAAVLAGLVLGGIQIYDQVVNVTSAPYCQDETETEALRLIARAGLLCEITRISDAKVPTGYVIMQSPEYGTAMRKNETVFLTISTGPEEQEIPSIIGYSVEEARNELERLGFTLLALPERVLSSSAWDTVMKQDPEAGEMKPDGSVVQVKLSGGSVTLPDFTGMTRQEALFLIQQLQLNILEIREIPVDDSSQYERVAAQLFTNDDGTVSYAAGDQVIQHTMVTLAVYVSNEPEAAVLTETVPDTAASEEELNQ
jgi:serine/threonine-protein kinase